jgi:hypothetical protein
MHLTDTTREEVTRIVDAYMPLGGAHFVVEELEPIMDRLTAEIEEQARLLGISGERELALLAKLERAERENERLRGQGECICVKCGIRHGGSNHEPGYF